MVINFNQPVSAAAFAIVDQGANYTISAFLGNTLVESFGLNVGFNPGAGFVGFENITFDSIQISNNQGSGTTIDTLQFNSAVPEPATMAVFGMMAVGALTVRRRNKATV